jgi:hypothetical protein
VWGVLRPLEPMICLCANPFCLVAKLPPDDVEELRDHLHWPMDCS